MMKMFSQQFVAFLATIFLLLSCDENKETRQELDNMLSWLNRCKGNEVLEPDQLVEAERKLNSLMASVSAFDSLTLAKVSSVKKYITERKKIIAAHKRQRLLANRKKQESLQKLIRLTKYYTSNAEELDYYKITNTSSRKYLRIILTQRSVERFRNSNNVRNISFTYYAYIEPEKTYKFTAEKSEIGFSTYKSTIDILEPKINRIDEIQENRLNSYGVNEFGVYKSNPKILDY